MKALIKLVLICVLCVGLLHLLLLPVFVTTRETVRRMQCNCNLKQICFGLHSYHDFHGCFPPAYVADKNGRPMHSWRTLVLPNLDGTQFYNSYDFNKPWNDFNNRKLALQNGPLIRCPSCTNWRPQMTNYVAVTGPGTAWPGDKSICMKDITDGTCNTILLVEVADSGIHWTEPRDITLEEALGTYNNGITTVPSSNHCTRASYFFKSLPLAGHVVMADGYIRFLPTRLEPEDLEVLLSIDGGESVDIEQLLIAPEYPLYKRLRWDHVIGLPLFLVSLVWFWCRLLQKPTDSEA